MGWNNLRGDEGYKNVNKCKTRKYLIENKLIICALGNLHYRISREKVVERRAGNPEVRGSNSGSGSNFSLEIL